MTRPNGLATVPQPAIDRTAVLRAIGIDANTPQGQAVVLTCQRYGLDPILRHMVLIDGRPFITRDGLLHVAHASGQFDGIEIRSTGETSTHYTATAAVFRKDMAIPFVYPGRFPKLRWEWEGGRDSRKRVQKAHPYGPEMAIKCAESMALRRAFDVSMGSAEELWDREAPAAGQAMAIDHSIPASEPIPASDEEAPGDFVTWLQTQVDDAENHWKLTCQQAKEEHKPLGYKDKPLNIWHVCNGVVNDWVSRHIFTRADVQTNGKWDQKKAFAAVIHEWNQGDERRNDLIQDIRNYLDGKIQAAAAQAGINQDSEPTEEQADR